MKLSAIVASGISLLALPALGAGKDAKPTAVAAATPAPAPATPAPEMKGEWKPAQGDESPLLPGEEARPFSRRRVACRSVQLVVIQNGPIIANPASSVVVENEQGHSGLAIYVNRETGQMVAVTAWRDDSGVRSQTTLPGSPRIDYVDCQPGLTEGGIVIDYYDAKTSLPY